MAWVASPLVRVRPLVLGLAVGCALAGCSSSGTPSPDAGDRASARSATSDPASGDYPAADPGAPTGWGPTVGELATARGLVADWPAERLAGQVIVGRYAGADPAVPAAMVRDLHLAGVAVTSGNVVDGDQVRATTRAVSDAVREDGRDFPAVIGVDQEGGSVEHLRGIATEFPAFAYAGAAVAGAPRDGERVVTEAAATTGLELRDYGFTWVFAPVADVTAGAADVTIGSRSPSGDPTVAGRTVAAAVAGYRQAGIVSTVKHFPGHGRATANSHEVLPVVDAPSADLERVDVPPFREAIDAGAPAVMMAHIDVSAVAPGLPGSVAPRMYDYLREKLGFEGVTITDSMGMGGVLGRPKPAVQALSAGADLILMPVDTLVTHGLLTEAIESGEVPRERAVDAASRVVALQLWQRREARRTPVPADVTTRAQGAAAALASLG